MAAIRALPRMSPFWYSTPFDREHRGGTETDLYLTLRRPDGTWTKPPEYGSSN